MWRIFLLSIIVFSMSSFLSAKAAINPDTHYNGHGYKIFNDGMTWQQAKSYCENQGGHLVTITSSQEQAVVETLLRTRGTKNSYWLGGCKSGNAWVWVTGESFSYSRWATWQPDGDGDALMVYRQNNPVVPDATPLGSWNDIRFDGICKGEPFFGANNFGFICEWDTLQENSATVTIPDGWYRIQPMHDLSRSADALGSQIGNGNNIHMWTNVEDALQQKFYLQNRGNCYFSLQSAYGNKLFVTANGRGNGANLYTNNWNNSDSQLFRLVNAGNNSYHIYAKVGVNLNFDCYGGYASDGNNIQLWTKENNAWHKWRFTKVTVGNNPQGTVQVAESTSPNTLHVRGTAFDQDNPSGSIRLHIYVGGTPGSNVPQYEIRTNGNNRVFDDTRKIDSNYSGRQLVRIYALNDYGSGENIEIWNGYVNIPGDNPTPSGLLFPLKGSIMVTPVSAKTKGLYCDYRASEGTPVYAPADGKVQFRQSYAVNYRKLASYGNNFVFTSSDGQYKVIGAHLSSFNNISLTIKDSLSYPCGQSNYKCTTMILETRDVHKGDLIGYTGMTGNAKGPHIHIEVTKNGTPVDPKAVFTTW